MDMNPTTSSMAFDVDSVVYPTVKQSVPLLSSLSLGKNITIKEPSDEPMEALVRAASGMNMGQADEPVSTTNSAAKVEDSDDVSCKEPMFSFGSCSSGRESGASNLKEFVQRPEIYADPELLEIVPNIR
ncbi:hypothetical protein D9758_000197 [Tetrapyrgos nigripes]|uniref:Uncharacterized protein n=1 Tax=Tetrapyrgos nigripes TaxID=182062 RepID=A0A8H5H1E5_9AGAR|nr:hypothetical protein D9758_000197 [Tetrapyrgos nigripes]